MRNHSTNIVAHDVDWLRDAQVLCQKRVNIACHDNLGVSVAGVRGMASTSVVGSNNTVSSIAQRCNDMAKLVGCLREAVDQENDTLGLCGRRAVDVVNRHLICP